MRERQDQSWRDLSRSACRGGSQTTASGWRQKRRSWASRKRCRKASG